MMVMSRNNNCINIKLALYKALIRSVMVYFCYACEYAVDTHFLILQHL
jgi:hypothetical protein